jgi:hypothetical protein
MQAPFRERAKNFHRPHTEDIYLKYSSELCIRNKRFVNLVFVLRRCGKEPQSVWVNFSHNNLLPSGEARRQLFQNETTVNKVSSFCPVFMRRGLNKQLKNNYL